MGALIQAPSFPGYDRIEDEIHELSGHLSTSGLSTAPLVVLTEDADFTSRSLSNFIWVCFTRSNPSHDVHGVGSFTEHKHWGCHGPLVIDARLKPHHAPPLVEDPKVHRLVDTLCAKGGSLHGIL